LSPNKKCEFLESVQRFGKMKGEIDIESSVQRRPTFFPSRLSLPLK
jgi:hypothetical protein